MDFQAVRKALLARPEKRHGRIVLPGLVLTLILMALNVGKPDFLRHMDYQLYDAALRAARFDGRDSPRPLPVIVDIDEKSLAEFGQWPWPRHRVAQLLGNINRMAPGIVGIDIVFPEPDRTSLKEVRRRFEAEFGYRVPLEAIPDYLTDNDAALGKALSEGPFVLSYGFVFSGQRREAADCPLHPIAIGGDAPPQGVFFEAASAVCSIPVIGRSAAGAGFFNVTPDDDGVLRRAPLVIGHNGRLYPSLSLQMTLQATGPRQVTPLFSGGVAEGLDMDGTRVPLDRKGQLLIRYEGKRLDFPRYSAADVLMDRVPGNPFKGAAVLVGTTAMGLETHRTTPLGTLKSGVEIHAAMIDNLMNRRFLAIPHWVMGLELVLVGFFGAASAVLVSRTRSLVSLGLLVLLSIGMWTGSCRALSQAGVFVSPFFPLLALAFNFSVLTFLKYRQEEKGLRQREKELVVMQNFTIQCLASLAETRDSETGRHIVRCQHYVKLLAGRLAKRAEFRNILDEETIDLLYKSAPLHDIGKVGVPDRILLKPGRLTEDEYTEMKKHTVYGRDAIDRAEQYYGQSVNGSFLRFGKEMAYAHHEKWDGTGYPQGLKGEEIPLFGRIMAIADVYDALICTRRYKPSFTHEDAVALIARGKGTHFDPLLVEVFKEVGDAFHEVAMAYPDA